MGPIQRLTGAAQGYRDACVPYNRISIAARPGVIALAYRLDTARIRRRAASLPSMNLRTPVVFVLVSLALWFAAAGPARAALVDDLKEVTRLHHAGQSAAALARADKFLATQPKEAQMRFLKAVVLADIGRSAEAATILHALTQDYPELAEPHNNLAALDAASGDYGNARSELEESLRLNPTFATAHENLGDVYVMLASQSYARALALEPANVSVPRKLALIRQLTIPAQAKSAASASASAGPRK